MQLLGAHMSISGGMHLAISRGEEIGCTAIQVFTKNASRWRGKKLNDADGEIFRRVWRESSVEAIIAHDSYLINLASPVEENRRRSRDAFLDEMERCALLGIPSLVMHPGAHMGAGEETGLARLCQSFKEIFTDAPADVAVLLENTAGQGTCLGSRFEHLVAVMEQVTNGRFGICFDTCHAFAAGYDIGSAEGFAVIIEEFDRIVGIEHLRAFHLNDSKKEFGSRVDRHEHIGEGAIGSEGFRTLMGDGRFTAIPKILETPKGKDDTLDIRNLATLRAMAEMR